MNSRFYLSVGIASTFMAVYSYAMAYSYGGTQVITSSEAKKILKENKKVKVIDVRTKPEWNLGHYKGALHLPC